MLPKVIKDFYDRHAARVSAEGHYFFTVHAPDGSLYRSYTAEESLGPNEDMHVQDQCPGFFALGDNGGDEIVCIELSAGRVVMIPMSSMSADNAIDIAESLQSLVEKAIRID